jgi:hypothetical protein
VHGSAHRRAIVRVDHSGTGGAVVLAVGVELLVRRLDLPLRDEVHLQARSSSVHARVVWLGPTGKSQLVCADYSVLQQAALGRKKTHTFLAH